MVCRRKRGLVSAEIQVSHDISADTAGEKCKSRARFVRLPLVVDVKLSGPEGPFVRVIAIHSKSKMVGNGERMWDNAETRDE